MVRTVGPISSGPAVGVAGAATCTVTSTTRIEGKIASVYLDYSAAAAATTKVVVETAGVTCPAQPILTVDGGNTDGWFYPVVAATDTAGAAIADEYQKIGISDQVTITVSKADPSDQVLVYLILE
jgi:hypothetical protein